MKNYGLTEEQEMALAIVANLLDDLGLSGEKYSLIESINEELDMQEIEEEFEIEELAETYGITDDDFFYGTSANEFLSELFEI